MRCQHCGKDIDESLFHSPLTYCPHCGQNLKASSKARTSEDVVFCPYCGKEVSSGVNFCPYCGEELARRTTAYFDKQKDSELTEQKVTPIIDTSGQKKRDDKLYKQWMKYADLPSDAIPSKESPRDTLPKPERKTPRLSTLYILLGVFVVLLVVGLVLLTRSG